MLQEMYVLSPSSLDQGASLLTSNCLSSATDLQCRIKGITCCCYFFCSIFYVILLYFLLVISCSDIQKANKVVDYSRLMKYAVVPIGYWLFCTCYILGCLFRFRDQRFLYFV